MTASSARRKLGWALTIVGLAMILGGVLYVLETVGHAEGGRFENRRSYDQVKVAVHRSFPTGFATGIAGLALAMLGARLRSRSEGDANRGE